MAYEPHEWQVGDKITSARLNNMEYGILVANNVMLSVQEANGGKTLNASYDNVVGALMAGQMVFIIDSISHPGYTQIMPVVGYGYDSSLGKYRIEALDYSLLSQNSLSQIFETNSRAGQLVESTESDLPK